MIPLLIGITFLSFVVVDLAPGDFFATLRLNPSISPDLIRQMEIEFGYGEPLLVRYGRWLWRVVHLDLGVSIAYRVAVLDLDRLAGVEHADPRGREHAVHVGPRDSDRHRRGALRAARSSTARCRSLAFFGMSMPNFFLAFLLMYVALETGWFPVGGTTSLDYPLLGPWEQVADRAAHLVLPVIVLGTSGMASLMRLMRSNILEIQNAEYVRTARAKGLPERVVVGKHILRNALNPFVTLAGYELGTLLGGAALVEAVMNLQGLGTLMLDAVRSLDLYLVMGSVLMGSLLLLFGNLLADVALTFVDPRIDFARLEAAR